VDNWDKLVKKVISRSLPELLYHPIASGKNFSFFLMKIWSITVNDCLWRHHTYS